MAQKLNKNLETLRSQVSLNNDEEFVGAFMGRSRMRGWWFFLLGALASLTMKQYQIIVTNQRILFGRLSLIGKLAGIDAFNFGEIKRASFKKGLITYTITFVFKNGRSLILDANHKGMVSIEGALFDSRLEDYLSKAIA